LGLPVLRAVLLSHAFAVLAQSVFAGQFLSGADGPVRFHELTGWIIVAIAAIQVLLAAVLMRPGGTSLWFLFGSIFLLLAEGLQAGTGYGRFLNVHVPLGVIIFGAVIALTISAFRITAPSAGAAG
jgi:hypothetical protein